MSPAADDLQSLENRIATGFAKVGLVMRHEAWRQGGERGLSPTQGQILAALGSTSEPLGPRALAERLALTLPTVSEAVSTLAEKELLEKRRHPEDGRATILSLTRRGRSEARKAAAGPPSLLEAARDMTPEQQEGLVVGLVAMVESLQRQGLIPVSRLCVGCVHFRPNAQGRGHHHCNLIDAPLEAADLRFDCPEQEPADPESAEELWSAFREGRSATV